MLAGRVLHNLLRDLPCFFYEKSRQHPSNLDLHQCLSIKSWFLSFYPLVNSTACCRTLLAIKPVLSFLPTVC